MSATDVGLAVNPHVLDGVEVRAKTQKPNQSGTDGAWLSTLGNRISLKVSQDDCWSNDKIMQQNISWFFFIWAFAVLLWNFGQFCFLCLQMFYFSGSQHLKWDKDDHSLEWNLWSQSYRQETGWWLPGNLQSLVKMCHLWPAGVCLPRANWINNFLISLVAYRLPPLPAWKTTSNIC